MTRDNVIKQALLLSNQHTHLILNWATGVGKSKGAIKIIEKFKPQRVLLIVAETPHKDNWKSEFEKWKGDWSKVTVECYASLKNYKDTQWDMIILDEGHHANSDLRQDILSSIRVTRVIVLTATLDTDDISNLEVVFKHSFYTYSITLQDAISNNILPTPKIYLVPLELDKLNYTEIIEESWGSILNQKQVSILFEQRFQYLDKRRYPSIKLTIRCTPFQKYVYLTDKQEYFKRLYMRLRQEFQKNKWLQLGSIKKRFLASLKTDITNKILILCRNKRYICFCGSIEQAELLDKNACIHSKQKATLQRIQDFNIKKMNSLIAVNMLQEGQNLKDIEVGIITQLDGKERAFIQKFGRTLRADNPIQIILYFKNTRDEEYLNSALEDINNEYIQTISNLSEIKL